MKTVKEWLQELPDGYRERALANLPTYSGGLLVDAQHRAVRKLRFWSETKEGYKFWASVVSYLMGECSEFPPLPQPTRRERIEKRIEEVMTENNLTDEDLGKTTYENGTIDALQWVLDNIDLNDDDHE